MFGLMGGDFDDDFLGNHMNAMNMQMRSMNRLMNTFMPDPFNMLAPFDPGFQQPQNALMERGGPAGMGGLFGFPAMPNMNRLLSADIGSPMTSYCSSSVMTMSSGPDGRPQIYQATSSTKTGPGGIRETRKTVQDSSRGLKKMAIGHHIGERAHIIEKEQDLRSGQLEERQEFINLDEDEAEDFDHEFTSRASHGRGGVRGSNAVPAIRAPPRQMLTIEPVDDDDDDDVVEEVPQQTHAYAGRQQQPQQSRRQLPDLPAPPAAHQQNSSVSSSAALHDALANNITSRVHNNNIINANNNNNNNNNYISSNRRSSAYHHRLANGSAGGASPRRPLRTPPASPLATSPTSHNHSTAATPSVHPHPYNAAAARRNHRPKHTMHQQQSTDAVKSTGAVKKSKTQPEEEH